MNTISIVRMRTSPDAMEELENRIQGLELSDTATTTEQIWYDDLQVELGEYEKRGIRDIVFRAASSSSQGVNCDIGMKANIYQGRDWGDIPSLEDIARPEHKDAYSREEIEFETRKHLYKYQTEYPTGWISTTSSLFRALEIVFADHGDGGIVYVIDTTRCRQSEVYSAVKLRDALPGLKRDKYLEEKSPNEFLIRGKIDSDAILGSASAASLRGSSLDVIAPGMGNMQRWDQKLPWNRNRIYLSEKVVDAAIGLGLEFGLDQPNTTLRIAKLVLNHEHFRIYQWTRQFKPLESDEELLRRIDTALQRRSRLEDSLGRPSLEMQSLVDTLQKSLSSLI